MLNVKQVIRPLVRQFCCHVTAEPAICPGHVMPPPQHGSPADRCHVSAESGRGVGHVMAVSPSGDELVQLVEDAAAAQTEAEGEEQEAEGTEERTGAEGEDRREATAQVRGGVMDGGCQ